MGKFDPEKLTVTYSGVCPAAPILPRHYTLSHSDITGKLSLHISSKPTCSQLNASHDEVLADWHNFDKSYILRVSINVDGSAVVKDEAAYRFEIFKQNLPLALTAIRYGDNKFFDAHPWLDYSAIFVHFLSSYPEYNVVKYFGQPLDYLLMD